MNAPVPAPPSQLVVRRHYAEAARLTDAGVSRREIAAQLGVSTSAVGKILASGPLANPTGRRRSRSERDMPRPREARTAGDTQRLVFEAVRDRGPITMTEISIEIESRATSAVARVLRLYVLHGVVVRDVGPDRRARYRVTPHGAEAYAALAQRLAEIRSRSGRPPSEQLAAQAKTEARRLRTRVLTVALEREARASDAYREAVRLSQWGLQQHYRTEVLSAQSDARVAAIEAARVGVDVASVVEAWRAQVAARGLSVEHGSTARLGGHR